MRHRSGVVIVSLAGLVVAGCGSRGGGKDARERIAREIAGSPEAQAVSDGVRQFSLDLYARLRSGRAGNLVFSPRGVTTVLAMALGGARGSTEAEIARVLHLPGPLKAGHSAFRLLRLSLASDGGERGYRWIEAGRLWGQEGIRFQPDFLSLLRDDHGAELGLVDFEKQGQHAREAINAWVAERTEGKIQGLIPEGGLDASTRLVLTSAVYFKGEWTRKFDAAQTREAPFHLAPGQAVSVPLMFREGSYRYAAIEGLKVLEIPYGEKDVAMLVLLPDAMDGLAALEERLTAENLERWVGNLNMRTVEVSLPRFRSTSRFELRDTLRAMGMPLAFTPGEADFSGMNQARDLLLARLIHSAYVEVNEEGTEAAAATSGAIKSADSLEPPPEFRADHPFLFLIRHNATRGVLFLGRVADPRAQPEPGPS